MQGEAEFHSGGAVVYGGIADGTLSAMELDEAPHQRQSQTI